MEEKKMKNKANRNIDAAQRLIDGRFYTESVHCSYYSILQSIKYILACKISKPIPYEEQESKIKDTNSDTHNWLIDQIRNNINNGKICKSVAEGIRNLKKERVKADYDLAVFNDEDSIGCREMAVSVRSKLNNIFKAEL